MRRDTARFVLCLGALTLACACSGSDSSSPSGGSERAERFFMDFAELVSVGLDEDCVGELVSSLSEHDVATLASTRLERAEELADQPFGESINEVGERIFDDCVVSEPDS